MKVLSTWIRIIDLFIDIPIRACGQLFTAAGLRPVGPVRRKLAVYAFIGLLFGKLLDAGQVLSSERTTSVHSPIQPVYSGVARLVPDEVDALSHYKSYRFLNHKKQERQVEVFIPPRWIEKSLAVFGYSERELRESILDMVQKFNHTYKGRARFVLNDKGLGYTYDYRRNGRKIPDRFKAAYEERIDDYFREHMLVRGEKMFRPDYRRIQKWQAPALAGVYASLRLTALNSQMNKREWVYLLASFVQHLEYKIPPPASNRENLGFWPPVVCLYEKAGDCDSKSALLATLYYHYRKNASVLMLTSRHAFVGIKNLHRHLPTDKTFRIGGIEYLLIETTSPAWGIGRVHATQMALLRNSVVQYVFFN